MKSFLIILNIFLVLSIAFLAGLKAMIPISGTVTIILFLVLTLLAPGSTIIAFQEAGHRRLQRERRYRWGAMILNGLYFMLLAALMYVALAGIGTTPLPIKQNIFVTTIWAGITMVPVVNLVGLMTLSRISR